MKIKFVFLILCVMKLSTPGILVKSKQSQRIERKLMTKQEIFKDNAFKILKFFFYYVYQTQEYNDDLKDANDKALKLAFKYAKVNGNEKFSDEKGFKEQLKVGEREENKIEIGTGTEPGAEKKIYVIIRMYSNLKAEDHPTDQGVKEKEKSLVKKQNEQPDITEDSEKLKEDKKKQRLDKKRKKPKMEVYIETKGSKRKSTLYLTYGEDGSNDNSSLFLKKRMWKFVENTTQEVFLLNDIKQDIYDLLSFIFNKDWQEGQSMNEIEKGGNIFENQTDTESDTKENDDTDNLKFSVFVIDKKGANGMEVIKTKGQEIAGENDYLYYVLVPNHSSIDPFEVIIYQENEDNIKAMIQSSFTNYEINLGRITKNFIIRKLQEKLIFMKNKIYGFLNKIQTAKAPTRLKDFEEKLKKLETLKEVKTSDDVEMTSNTSNGFMNSVEITFKPKIGKKITKNYPIISQYDPLLFIRSFAEYEAEKVYRSTDPDDPKSNKSQLIKPYLDQTKVLKVDESNFMRMIYEPDTEEEPLDLKNEKKLILTKCKGTEHNLPFKSPWLNTSYMAYKWMTKKEQNDTYKNNHENQFPFIFKLDSPSK